MRPLVMLIAVLCVGGVAGAHASAERSEPPVGSQVRVPPTEVKVWFNVGVDPKLSKIEVFDAHGRRVDKKDTHLAGKSTRALVVSLTAPLPAGEYKVHWEAVAADTHRTQNDYKFVVKP